MGFRKEPKVDEIDDESGGEDNRADADCPIEKRRCGVFQGGKMQ